MCVDSKLLNLKNNRAVDENLKVLTTLLTALLKKCLNSYFCCKNSELAMYSVVVQNVELWIHNMVFENFKLLGEINFLFYAAC